MKRVSFPDSTAAEIDDQGRWDMTLPSGKHIRGHAATVPDAEAQINREHDKFVLDRWA